MAYSEKQLQKGSINAKKALDFLAKSKEGLTGKNLTVIDNDTQEISTKPAVDVNKAINEITASWRKTAFQIIETCILLREYKKSANWRVIEIELEKRKLIPMPVLKQLLAISANNVLTDKKYIPQLPPVLNTIYKASQIEEGALKNTFESKKIQPNLTTKEFLKVIEKLPRRNASWDRRKEAELKASSVTVTFSVELPVQGHKKSANEILKHLMEHYSNEEYHVKLNDKVRFNY